MTPELLCERVGPATEAFRSVCSEAGVRGCFSIMERNPHGAPYNTGIWSMGDAMIYNVEGYAILEGDGHPGRVVTGGTAQGFDRTRGSGPPHEHELDEGTRGPAGG